MAHSLSLVLTLTIGFFLASIFAFIVQRLKLPTILGYLLAGYLIGPYSPGFVADLSIAEQLAEVGVVLMLFGVGLHFKIENLVNVKNIAIPGAIGQTFAATAIALLLVFALGYSLETGLIIGLSVAVASTVVLMKLLTENNLLDTPQGHISVGWLVVEDIFTVAVLILLPTIAAFSAGEKLSIWNILGSLCFIGIKFSVLALLMFTWGQKAVSYVLTKIAHQRSQELLSLAVLAFVFFIATASSAVFGTSIALGAFIAGMVIGKTSVRYQAASNALPLKDIFTIIFFLSVGMLFNPMAIGNNLPLFFVIFFIILAVKPLIAYLISALLGYPLKVSLTIAVALAQIGEFSFILAEEAMQLQLISEEIFDLLVAEAFLSIALNAVLFPFIDSFEKKLQRFPLSRRKQERSLKILKHRKSESAKIVIVGFGPIGKRIAAIFKTARFTPSIIEENIDTVTESEKQDMIIYGDATDGNILQEAQLGQASHLFITIPQIDKTLSIIRSARQINPQVSIVARVQYLSEKSLMEELGVDYVCSEEEMLRNFTALIYKKLNYND